MKNNKYEEESNIVPDFIMIPYKVFSNPKLSSTDKFVYGAVHFFANLSSKKCTASNQVLADFIKSTPSTVSNSLVLLEECGHLSRVFFDDSHRRRKEIIPLAMSGRLPRNKVFDTPRDVSKHDKSNTPMDVSNTPIDVSKVVKSNTPIDVSNTPIDVSDTPMSVSEVESQKEIINIDNISIKAKKGQNSDTPIGEEREKGNRIAIENNNIESQEGPSDPLEKSSNLADNLVSHLGTKTGSFTGKVKQAMKFADLAEVPETMVAECIALFLPVFPDLFVNKNPFAVPATRNAIKKVLMTVSPEELKIIIDKYMAGFTDKFRPDASSIFDFCTYKFEKIKAYSAKSAGGLWAQKSISTPEQSKVRSIQYQGSLEKSREKARLAKEQWEKEHPAE